MQCPSCGFANPEGMNFCGKCAASLLPTCPQCGFENPAGFAFCGKCATPLTTSTAVPGLPQAESLQPEPPTPDAERRQLTVMFCDLADSTRLSGQLDPEDLRDVIRAYQATCAEVIERYDGYIAQHLGDGLMVYFGWPQAHEDDAQRAVHAGLGIVEAMHGLNDPLEQEKAIRLAVRIGIHTGLVVVGEIGSGASQEHLALGETPNLASRIEGFAASDTVAISEATHRLIQGYFDCDTLGAHTLKGVKAPMPVYRVIRERALQTRFEVARTHGLTPLVGREDEVALMQRRWILSTEGQGQVVLLSGEGGIGKSRLVEVIHEQAKSEGCPRIVFRCSPYHTNSALYPVIDHLKRVLNLQLGDLPATRLDKLEDELRATHFTLEEVIPLFAELLSIPMTKRYPSHHLTPQQQRQRTLDALIAWLLQEAEQHPVLVVWEDLHWADPSSLELLSLLIERVSSARMLILTTFRPEFVPPWAMVAHLAHLTINRFAPQQIEYISTHVAGGKALPADVIQHLVSQTDGIPLFVEELTKSVLESGLLEEHDDHYTLTGALPALAIPTTLHDALMSRLDRLDTAKSVAQLGATLGRTFSYELLQAVSPLDEVTLQQALSHLIEAELLTQRGIPPQATYIFKHALIQDTAYQSLLRSTRQQIHQRIAACLVERFPDISTTQPELIAQHYSEAACPEQAVSYWWRAVERARQRHAYAEAIEHCTSGIALLTELPETPDHIRQEIMLQAALGALLTAVKGFAVPEAKHAYERARQRCQQIGDTSQLFPVLVGLCLYHLVNTAYRTAQELVEQLLNLAEQSADSNRLTAAAR